jgi:RNA polymerase sigma-70 factor (ECF subfamily)
MGDEAEDRLIAAARAGSTAAFGRLVDRHQPAVRGFLRRISSNREEAEDLAQETFFAAWSRLASWRGDSDICAWLCGIAWKKARAQQRSLFRRLRRDAAYVEITSLERADEADVEDRIALAAAMSELPLERRAAVALCLGEGFSHADAASTLGLPLGTVKSHVSRGRARLLSFLGENK